MDEAMTDERDPAAARLQEIRERLLLLADDWDGERHMLRAPCVFCGYEGQGYWQEGTHDEACPWRDVGGEIHRQERVVGVVRAALQSAHARAATLEQLYDKVTGEQAEELCKLTTQLESAEAHLAQRTAERDEARARDVLTAPMAAGLLMQLKEECEAQHARAEAAEARVRALEEALRAVTADMDRAGGDGHGMPQCPWCGWRYEPSEHASNCELLKARVLLSEAAPVRREPERDTDA
jgi:hypothetical protein